MDIIDLIIKKRDKRELTDKEIKYFIEGTVKQEFKDYQISSMLMAMFINSLTLNETVSLTMAMAQSGEILDFSEIEGIKTDKHSTGGVADTTTLITAPLCASCGLSVIKMSGRGLGHTGGTIDKLDSIPNFNSCLTKKEACELVSKNKIVLMQATKNLAPADKILYSLRDVTGTVESIPLIASSIMSKKIASGADAIVLDVKCGNGAFMKDINSAKSLAEIMINIGENISKNVSAIITDMNEPLGMNIGNSIEVIEAIEVLKGNKSGRLKEVSLELGAHMLLLGKICKSVSEGKKMLEENIKNKKGLEKLKNLIKCQGGNESVIDDYSLFPQAKSKLTVTSLKSGYIYNMNTYKIGKAALETGAGRRTKEDIIDLSAGIKMKCKIGDYVSVGDILAEIYSSSSEKCIQAKNTLLYSIEISKNKPELKNTIINF